jgi:hypothetical protein
MHRVWWRCFWYIAQTMAQREREDIITRRWSEEHPLPPTNTHTLSTDSSPTLVRVSCPLFSNPTCFCFQSDGSCVFTPVNWPGQLTTFILPHTNNKPNDSTQKQQQSLINPQVRFCRLRSVYLYVCVWGDKPFVFDSDPEKGLFWFRVVYQD